MTQTLLPSNIFWGELVPTDSDGSGDTESAEKKWRTLALGFILFFMLVHIKDSWESWQQAHVRRARLTAYRRRNRWRKADVPRLHKLGVPWGRIQRIMDGNMRRGRGVVQSYQSLDEIAMLMAERFTVLLSRDTAPHARLATLKQTPFWPQIVDALYRGESLAAKETRQKSPSAHAERVVADCLGITEALVHKICTSVRKERKQENNPPELGLVIRIADFEAWKLDGDLEHTFVGG